MNEYARKALAGCVPLLAALLATQTHPALAGSFDVNPIRINLSAESRTSALTVRNSGAEPVVVQVSSNAWSQDKGKDVLNTTNDLVVSPPVVTIAAGEEQVIRIGLRRAPDGEKELSYRIFLQEVPPPPRPGFQGLVVALRVGLPVFVQPRKGDAKANLLWSADLSTPDAVKLSVDNRGTGHIQVSTVQLYPPGHSDPVAEFSGVAYVLPGQAREWDLKLRQPSVKKGDRLRMRVSTDAGSIDTGIELGGP